MNWEEVLSVEKAAEWKPKIAPAVLAAALYLAGNYWQGSNAWAGTPVPEEASNRDKILEQLERTFIPTPLIEEAAERHLNGVLGNEPATEWVLARALKEDEQPSTSEAELLAELNGALTEWWDAHEMHVTVRECGQTLLATGRGPLRLLIPSGLKPMRTANPSSGPRTGSTRWIKSGSKCRASSTLPSRSTKRR